MKSIDAYGKLTVGDSGEKTQKEVEQLIKEIKGLEVKKKKVDYSIPDVVDRLVSNTEQCHSRIRAAVKRTPRKVPEIKKVKKVSVGRDETPSAAHYNPNFSATVSTPPSIKIEESHALKPASLNQNTMTQMLEIWANSIREYSFQPEKPRTEQDHSTYSPFFQPPSPGPGIMSSKSNRDGWLKRPKTPGPTHYDVKVPPKTSPPRQISFDKQSSRPPLKPTNAAVRDVRSGMDAVRPRTPQSIPFAKQSSRDPDSKKDDDMWEEIAAEQARIGTMLAENEEKKPVKPKKKEPFALQTSKPREVFGHIMRREWEPKEPLEVREMKRPNTAFDIRQPALGNDRMVYRKSEAPDVFYGNVSEQFQNTVKRNPPPLEMDRQESKSHPYKYMPKGCGSGKLIEPKSTLSPICTVDISKMGKRRLMLDTPGSCKKRFPPAFGDFPNSIQK